MGWFWETKSESASQDAYNKLDPSLQEFLKNETQSTSQKSQIERQRQIPSPAQIDRPAQSYTNQLGIPAPDDSPSTATRPTHNDNGVPAEAVYQDGRYAHLWKNYRPQHLVEDSGKNDADRLADIVGAYKERTAAVGAVALENCIDLQIALQRCFREGTWAQNMTMCRTENREFIRCFEMQSRFLRALGYIAMNRSAEEEERIQMHADKLYHQMLDRERTVKEAKEKGTEAPVLPPLIQPESVTQALGPDSSWTKLREKAAQSGQTLSLSMFPLSKQEEIKERIKGKTKDEQDLELQLAAAEARAVGEYADRINENMDEERIHRADRRARGKETMGDTIKRWWGWAQ
jgi:hypothetical protein